MLNSNPSMFGNLIFTVDLEGTVTREPVKIQKVFVDIGHYTLFVTR